MKTMLIALATAGAVLAAAPAAAEDMVVKYRDLNLSTVQGQQQLDQRIDRAARQICGMDERVTGSRIKSSSAARCYAQAKAQAKEAIAALVSQGQLGG